MGGVRGTHGKAAGPDTSHGRHGVHRTVYSFMSIRRFLRYHKALRGCKRAGSDFPIVTAWQKPTAEFAERVIGKRRRATRTAPDQHSMTRCGPPPGPARR